jgi:predicted metal-binding membrane protein
MYALARRTRLALAWKPEWPITVLIAAAWALLAAGSLWPDGPGSSTGLLSPLFYCAAYHATGLGVSLQSASAPVTRFAIASRSSSLSAQSFFAALTGWELMSVAMMLPVTLPAVRHVAVNSLRVRRVRAMALFIGVFLVLWLAFGVAVVALARLLAEVAPLDSRYLVAGSLVIAAAWQLSGYKRLALFLCHRTVPLPPLGLRADAACARYGVMQASRCFLSCWALMLSLELGGFGLLPMALACLLLLGEEVTKYRYLLRLPAAGTLAVVAGVVALGF